MANVGAITLPKITVAGSAEFSVARLREFVSTSLSDFSLQTLLNGAFLAIDDAIGPLEDVRESFAAVPGDLLMLSVRAESITSVVENARFQPLSLDATDYELSPSGRTLRRLMTGTHPIWNWWGRVTVTYRPFSNVAERIRVAVELIRLEISWHPGLASQSIGTWTESYQQGKPYAVQRAEILASLSPSALPI